MSRTKTPKFRADLASRLDAEGAEALFAEADAVRREFCGEDIHLRGIIEFSNHCRRNCLYCGLRAGNAAVRRYRMAEAEIIDAARAGAALGVKTVVLQSGEDMYYDARRMCDIVRGIKAGCDVAITLSMGERPLSDYQAMREAGADRYLLKHETANREIFTALHPDDDFDERIACLKELKALGYQIGSGIMVGLPGQTIEDFADDILLLSELDVDMAGIGPFIPHPRTPLGNSPPGSAEMTLRVIALTRVVLKDAHIPATTALETVDPGMRRRALQCGANVIMPNITPPKYRADYEIYPGKAGVPQTPEDCVVAVRAIAASLRRPIAAGPGHSMKRNVR